ncbi:hypothetical protein TNCV_4711531 [Trichonephila clavipes]|nr:hypothetical protein TNCV_4711531 [Trichonephila clavipes]
MKHPKGINKKNCRLNPVLSMGGCCCFSSPCLAQLDQIRYLIHSQKRPILLEGLHIDSPSQSRMCFGDAWQAEHLTQVKGNFVSIRKSQWWRSDSGNESE